jgi:hypothetical protein
MHVNKGFGRCFMLSPKKKPSLCRKGKIVEAPGGLTNVQELMRFARNYMTDQTTVIICILWPRLRVGDVSIEPLRIELLLWLRGKFLGGLAIGSVKTRVNAGLDSHRGAASGLGDLPSDFRIRSAKVRLSTLARCTRSRRLVVSNGILFED